MSSAAMTARPLPSDEPVPAEEVLHLIPVHLIDIPKEHRHITDQAIAEMAADIADIGLLQPIGVFTAPDGRYTLCFGGTRLAAHKRLGRERIQARIFDVEDPEQRQIMTDIENIRRTRLTPAEEALAMGRWRDWYVKKHPESRMTPREYTKKTGGGAAKAAPFTSHAKGKVGQSERAVQYSLKIRKKIQPEYLQQFALRETSRTDLLKIAAIEKQEDRDSVCNLVIYFNLPLDEVIADVTAPKDAIVEHKQTRAIPPDIPPLQERSIDDLSDDEWFNQTCKDVAKRLRDTTLYKQEAILYRQILTPRAEFRSKTRKHLGQGTPRWRKSGPFHYLICRAVNIDEPSTWLPCGTCDGTGIVRGNDCANCHGAAYTLTSSSVKREKRI